MAMAHLITTLNLGPFSDNLTMHPTTNMDDLCQRVAQFMHLEDLREFRNQAKAKQNQEK